jgi:hypothetical protein
LAVYMYGTQPRGLYCPSTHCPLSKIALRRVKYNPFWRLLFARYSHQSTYWQESYPRKSRHIPIEMATPARAKNTRLALAGLSLTIATPTTLALHDECERVTHDICVHSLEEGKRFTCPSQVCYYNVLGLACVQIECYSFTQCLARKMRISEHFCDVITHFRDSCLSS